MDVNNIVRFGWLFYFTNLNQAMKRNVINIFVMAQKIDMAVDPIPQTL